MGNFLEQFDPKKKYEKLRAEAKDLSDEQLEELHMNSKLTHLKILKAYKRFQEYLHVLYPDNFDVKEIPVDKFKHIPCLHFNPLRKRMIVCSRLKKRDPKDPVTFTDFVSLLATLNPQGKIENKLKFAFRLYDFNGDGKICIDDMKKYVATVTHFDVEQQQDENNEDGESSEQASVAKKDKTASTGADNSDADKSKGTAKEKEKEKEDQTKKKKKKKKKKNSDYDLSPDEVITQVAEKTIQELTGSETGKIKFEDFAKTLLHSDFAGKYSLHLSLSRSVFQVFQKIMERVDDENYTDPIQDDDVVEKAKTAQDISAIEITPEEKEATVLDVKTSDAKSDGDSKESKAKSDTTRQQEPLYYEDAEDAEDYDEDYDSDYYYDENDEDPYDMENYKPAQK